MSEQPPEGYAPPSPEQAAAMLAAQAVAEQAHQGRLAAIAAASSVRTTLSDALALAPLYPAPSPDETAIIDAQVAAALAQFRALADPPPDVVALAAAVVAWRAEIA